jgi:hypothetical protein
VQHGTNLKSKEGTQYTIPVTMIAKLWGGNWEKLLHLAIFSVSWSTRKSRTTMWTLFCSSAPSVPAGSASGESGIFWCNFWKMKTHSSESPLTVSLAPQGCTRPIMKSSWIDCAWGQELLPCAPN